MTGRLQRWRFHLAAASTLLLVVSVAAVAGTAAPKRVRLASGAGAGGQAAGSRRGLAGVAGGPATGVGQAGRSGPAATVAGSGRGPGARRGPAGPHVTYDDGADDKVVRVGGSTFLSGPAAVYGQQIAVGFAAGVKYVNDHGGINGRRMVSTTYDDGADPAKILSNTKRLVEIDHSFALGMVTAAITGPYLAQKGVPVAVEGQFDEDFTNPWFFPLGGPQVGAGMVLANYGAKVIGAKKVGIFYLDAGANNFSSAYAQKLAGFWKAYGVEVPVLEPFTPDQTSCSDAISAARNAKLDFVDFEIDAGHVIQCAVEAQIQGYKPPKSWGGYLIGVPVIPEALGDYSIGMYAFAAFGADYANQEYVADV